MLVDVTSRCTHVDASLIFYIYIYIYFHLVQLKGKGTKIFDHDDVLPLDCCRHFSACSSQTEKAGANKSRGRQRERRKADIKDKKSHRSGGLDCYR